MSAPVKVAITGVLSMKRADAVRLIEEKTNAKFSPSVSWDTSYLVASRFDTEKAHRAARVGTIVINEAEMLAFISKGSFPVIPTLAQRRAPSNLPDLAWTHEADPEKSFLLRYRDRDGALSDRFISCVLLGIDAHGVQYVGGFDVERFKEFRVDRIEAMAEAGAREQTDLREIHRYWKPIARGGPAPEFQPPATAPAPLVSAPVAPTSRTWFTVASARGDNWLAFRLVLLIAAVVCFFIDSLPWPVAFFFFVAWVLTLGRPKPKVAHLI